MNLNIYFLLHDELSICFELVNHYKNKQNLQEQKGS